MFVFSVRCLVSRQCHKISPLVGSNDSSVLASRTLTLSPSALLPLTRLQSLQGGADTPLAYKILCVRFTCFVHDGSSVPTKASLSAAGATLDTGGWLALTSNCPCFSPDRDFHPARSAKLRLAHQQKAPADCPKRCSLCSRRFEQRLSLTLSRWAKPGVSCRVKVPVG